MGTWIYAIHGNTTDFWNLTFKEYYAVLDASKGSKPKPVRFTDEERTHLENMKRGVFE